MCRRRPAHRAFRRPAGRRNNPPDGRWRSAPAPPSPQRRSTARAKRYRVGISWSLVSPPVLLLTPILIGPVPTSMRKRVEFPVSLDLPPAMRQAVRLEHQKRDEDQPDRDLAQEGDAG